MCYAAPAPRCAGHARTALQTAEAAKKSAFDGGSWNDQVAAVQQFSQAQQDYDATETGYRELMDRASVLDARGNRDAAESLRSRARNGEMHRTSKWDAYEEMHVRPDPEAAAHSEKSPGVMLERLARYESPTVRRLVASNPAASQKVLASLAERFPLQVAENPNASASTLTRIATDPFLRFTSSQLAAYRHPKLPAEAKKAVQASLYASDGTFTPLAATALLDDSTTPEKTLAALLQQGHSVAAHPNLGVALGVWVAKMSPDTIRGSEPRTVVLRDEHQALLKRHDLHPEVLIALRHTYAGYRDATERVASFDQIASHVNCPPRVRSDLLAA